jgi:hypothetical protein
MLSTVIAFGVFPGPAAGGVALHASKHQGPTFCCWQEYSGVGMSVQAVLALEGELAAAGLPCCSLRPKPDPRPGWDWGAPKLGLPWAAVCGAPDCSGVYCGGVEGAGAGAGNVGVGAGAMGTGAGAGAGGIGAGAGIGSGGAGMGAGIFGGGAVGGAVGGAGAAPPLAPAEALPGEGLGSGETGGDGGTVPEGRQTPLPTGGAGEPRPYAPALAPPGEGRWFWARRRPAGGKTQVVPGGQSWLEAQLWVGCMAAGKAGWQHSGLWHCATPC